MNTTNIFETSTQMSTDFVQLEKLQSELSLAKEIGARTQTIESLEKRLINLEQTIDADKKYKDLSFIQEWPIKILLKRYDQATKYAKQQLEQSDGIGLIQTDEEQAQIKKFEAALKLVEIIEDEGKRRQITPFIPDDELEEIFGAKPETDPSPISEANQTE